MTITPEQLDELERKAKAGLEVNPRHVSMVDCNVTLRLVAVYRAALAWNEARKHIAPAREALDDLGTRSARRNLDDAFYDLDRRQTALDAALRGKQ